MPGPAQREEHRLQGRHVDEVDVVDGEQERLPVRRGSQHGERRRDPHPVAVHGGPQVEGTLERGGLHVGQVGRLGQQRADQHRQGRTRDVPLGPVALDTDDPEPGGRTGFRRRVLQQVGPADPGITAQHDHLGAPGGGIGEYGEQRSALAVTAHQHPTEVSAERRAHKKSFGATCKPTQRSRRSAEHRPAGPPSGTVR